MEEADPRSFQTPSVSTGTTYTAMNPMVSVPYPRAIRSISPKRLMNVPKARSTRATAGRTQRGSSVPPSDRYPERRSLNAWIRPAPVSTSQPTFSAQTKPVSRAGGHLAQGANPHPFFQKGWSTQVRGGRFPQPRSSVNDVGFTAFTEHGSLCPAAKPAADFSASWC